MTEYVGFYGTARLPKTPPTGVALWYADDHTSSMLSAYLPEQIVHFPPPAEWPHPPEPWTWLACVPVRYAGTEGFINTARTAVSDIDPKSDGWESVVIPPKLISWSDYQDEQEGDGP